MKRYFLLLFIVSCQTLPVTKRVAMHMQLQRAVEAFNTPVLPGAENEEYLVNYLINKLH
ncbi:MAG TPA: hypothetical protein QGF02_01305 [Candidatus Babeliales bacterium]|nr:hypothetical protein [Candidatus Babeliales bacterium]